MSQAVLDNKISELTPDVGVRLESRKAIAKSLGDILADAFRLKFNLQALHWNVEGPLFFSMHKMTEEQYEDMEASVDVLAERIRSLGLPAPQTLQSMQKGSIIEDLPERLDVKGRVERLVSDLERAGLRMHSVIKAAEEAGDITTADLLTERLGRYEEFAWMLRASIASPS